MATQVQIKLEEVVRQARQVLAADNLEYVIVYCRHILKYHPRDLGTLRLLGSVYRRKHYWNEAARLLDFALSADPHDLSAYLERGALAYQQGQPERALDFYSRLLEFNVEIKGLREEVARLQALSGSRTPLRSIRIKLARQRLEEGKYSQALSEYDFLLDKLGNRPDIELWRLEACWRTQDYNRAERLAYELLQNHPHLVKANLILWHICLVQQRESSGQIYLERAIALDPLNRVAAKLFENAPQEKLIRRLFPILVGVATLPKVEPVKLLEADQHEVWLPGWLQNEKPAIRPLKLRSKETTVTAPAPVKLIEPLILPPALPLPSSRVRAELPLPASKIATLLPYFERVAYKLLPSSTEHRALPLFQQIWLILPLPSVVWGVLPAAKAVFAFLPTTKAVFGVLSAPTGAFAILPGQTKQPALLLKEGSRVWTTLLPSARQLYLKLLPEALGACSVMLPSARQVTLSLLSSGHRVTLKLLPSFRQTARLALPQPYLVRVALLKAGPLSTLKLLSYSSKIPNSLAVPKTPTYLLPRSRNISPKLLPYFKIRVVKLLISASVVPVAQLPQTIRLKLLSGPQITPFLLPSPATIDLPVVEILVILEEDCFEAVPSLALSGEIGQWLEQLRIVLPFPPRPPRLLPAPHPVVTTPVASIAAPEKETISETEKREEIKSEVRYSPSSAENGISSGGEATALPPARRPVVRPVSARPRTYRAEEKLATKPVNKSFPFQPQVTGSEQAKPQLINNPRTPATVNPSQSASPAQSEGNNLPVPLSNVPKFNAPLPPTPVTAQPVDSGYLRPTAASFSFGNERPRRANRGLIALLFLLLLTITGFNLALLLNQQNLTQEMLASRQEMNKYMQGQNSVLQTVIADRRSGDTSANPNPTQMAQLDKLQRLMLNNQEELAQLLAQASLAKNNTPAPNLAGSDNFGKMQGAATQQAANSAAPSSFLGAASGPVPLANESGAETIAGAVNGAEAVRLSQLSYAPRGWPAVGPITSPFGPRAKLVISGGGQGGAGSSTGQGGAGIGPKMQPYQVATTATATTAAADPATATATATSTSTASATPTIAPTNTATSTPAPTATPNCFITPAPGVTPTPVPGCPTPTPTATTAPTATATPTLAATATSTATAAPTATASPTNTLIPTATPLPTDTATPKPTKPATATPTATTAPPATDTAAPTDTPTLAPTETATATPSVVGSPTPTSDIAYPTATSVIQPSGTQIINLATTTPTATVPTPPPGTPVVAAPNPAAAPPNPASAANPSSYPVLPIPTFLPINGMQVGPGMEFHTGIDIGVREGTEVHATAGGVVEYAGDQRSGYGRVIFINHPGGFVTVYAHNSRLLVTAGQTVQAGQLIALSGNTGYSTGPHVHYEVRYQGRVIDPAPFMR
jgi:murein DD-endopeptidase MepM/ murein hydrolase activator NlpD/tetratricopeptide (TPR) repeat protein